MNSRSIRNSNVCVVGGAGFLGSHLVNHLIEDRNCEVLVIDNLISGQRSFVRESANFEYADITKSESHLRKLFNLYEIKYVFNYAAEPYIPVSFERPLYTFDVNAFGAFKVINAAHESDYCTAILQISSAELYGNGSHNWDTDTGQSEEISDEGHPITEEARVKPHSTYGAAKAAIDSLVQVRWKEAQVPVISLRQFNCIGERDVTHPYVVPEIIMQLHHNGSLIRLGNNSFRDFLYAGDQARIATELLEKGDFGEVYNFGSESGIKIYDLAILIGHIMGIEGVEVVPDASRVRPWEIWTLLSCNNKLYSVVDSRPMLALEESLARTISWFQEQNWRLDWWESTRQP